jgi:hypothetical protein
MKMKIWLHLSCFFACVLCAQDKPITKPGAIILDEDYAKPEANGRWTTVGGHWTIKDGVLMGVVAGNVPKRMSPHLVYSRRYHDIQLTARFQLVDNIGLIVRFEGWHGAQSMGVIISRDAILVQKLQARDDTHVEKNKFADLGRTTQKIDAGRWYNLTLSIVGDELKASIENGGTITVKNPGFDVDHSEISVVYSGGVGYLSKLKAVVPGS